MYLYAFTLTQMIVVIWKTNTLHHQCVSLSEVNTVWIFTSIHHMGLQYIPRKMHTVFALLCFVVVIHWLIFPYPSGLLHWHRGNLTIAPVPAKQPWWIWINTSCEFIMNDCITTTKQSTTKPCAYFLGYTVHAVMFALKEISLDPGNIPFYEPNVIISVLLFNFHTTILVAIFITDNAFNLLHPELFQTEANIRLCHVLIYHMDIKIVKFARKEDKHLSYIYRDIIWPA